jgi:hypothetical protein
VQAWDQQLDDMDVDRISRNTIFAYSSPLTMTDTVASIACSGLERIQKSEA